MGYIRYRKGVNDLRHLRHTLAADWAVGATGVSIGSAYALPQPISCHPGAKARPLHTIARARVPP